MSVDSISRDTLAERAMGQFPISIATSLAIESLVGILPEAPVAAPEILKRDLFMVNVRTLFRNLLGAVETDHRNKLDEFTMAEAISGEMRAIEAIVSEHSDGRCEVRFYFCSHTDILRKFDRALFKAPNTTLQHQYIAMETTTIKYLLKEFKDSAPIAQYTTEFPDTNANAVILSHYAIDLLQRYKFANLILLESHTGALKPPMLWNTKFVNGREFEIVPFDRAMLQIFGDGVIFSAMPIKIRQRVYNIATKNKWTPASTKALVIHSVEMNRDPALEVLVKDLYSK